MRVLRPDIIGIETGKCFKKFWLQWWLEDLYSSTFMEHPGPCHLGWPQTRPRFYALLMLRSKLSFVGDIHDYYNLFARSVELDGNCFFCADSDSVKHDLVTLAQRRWWSQDLPKHDEIDWALMYSAGVRERLQVYEAMRSEHQSLTGNFLCNVEHNSGAGPAPGRFFPCLLRHGTIYSFTDRRHALALEHLCTQGYPIAELAQEAGYKIPFEDALPQLSSSAIKSLAGNTQHMPTIATWLAYACGHLILHKTVDKTMISSCGSYSGSAPSGLLRGGTLNFSEEACEVDME